ncbi:MAG: hypothetical protein AAGA26_02095 [Pseudomonadota bacterium]
MPYDKEAAKKVAEFAKRQTTVDKGVPVVISKFENKWEIFLSKDRSTATLDNIKTRAGAAGFDKGKARVCTLYKNFLLCNEGSLSKTHLKVVNKSYIGDVYSKPLKAVNAKGEEIDLPDEVEDDVEGNEQVSAQPVQGDNQQTQEPIEETLAPDSNLVRAKELLSALKPRVVALKEDDSRAELAKVVVPNFTKAVELVKKGEGLEARKLATQIVEAFKKIDSKGRADLGPRLERSHTAWAAARKIMAEEMSKLSEAIIQAEKADVLNTKEDIEAITAGANGLKDHLNVFDGKLEAELKGATSKTVEEQKKVAEACVTLLSKYEEVLSNEFFAGVDDQATNGYANVAVRSTADKFLKQIKVWLQ